MPSMIPGILASGKAGFASRVTAAAAGHRDKCHHREPSAYVSLQRGSVRVGAARRAVPDARAARRPPAGVELVLEVDDVVAERDQITAAGWPVAEDLRDRPWGLRDFRVLDPAGYYLRITDRAR